MQEQQTLAFQPNYEGFLPWYSRIFLLYLFIVLIVIVVRVVRYAWCLRRLKKLHRAEEADPHQYQHPLERDLREGALIQRTGDTYIPCVTFGLQLVDV